MANVAAHSRPVTGISVAPESAYVSATSLSLSPKSKLHVVDE